MAEQPISKHGSKTRGRILAVCRKLFTERGPANVTTAEIAAAAKINEGNLYYHFQRKEQMVEALFEEFARSHHEAAAAYRAYGDDPRRYPEYFTGWFNLLWTWRFFYFEPPAVSLRPRMRALSDDSDNQIRGALEGMVALDLIRATPEQIEVLIVNAAIVATYWIDYLRSRHRVARVTREHMRWGASQVMSLFYPHLTPAGSALMARCIPQKPRPRQRRLGSRHADRPARERAAAAGQRDDRSPPIAVTTVDERPARAR